MRNVYVVIWQLTRVTPGGEAEAETSLHALRDCSFAKHVWRVVTPVTFSRVFLYMHIDEWVLWNNSFDFNDEDSSGREALLSCLSWAKGMDDRVCYKGVLQDFDAGWIFGFARKLGSMSVFQAEAGAMYEGLGLAWDKVGCKVEVESDNVLSIEVVKNTYADYNGLVEARIIKE
ncbi:hypothetical protein Golax_017567 [Gossypium laxum]|uniref:RNase H type-1 domain-containing protein n=1 Tax=Gossypium laxum TaxID=34288 RepID=A0A7J8Z0L9_9ROSI|nr:hypothetical protein [Gossypium laxum]